MPILDPLKADVVPCVCGRLSNKLHCPKCGSYDIRGTVKTTVRADPVTAERKEYYIYRCKRCSSAFDGYDHQFDCRAPYYQTESMRLKNSLDSGNSEDISKTLNSIGIKGVINKGKRFNAVVMDRATSPQGVRETRMRGFNLNAQQYLEVYEEKWGQFDRDKGIAPPHELQHKINSESEEKE